MACARFCYAWGITIPVQPLEHTSALVFQWLHWDGYTPSVTSSTLCTLESGSLFLFTFIITKSTQPKNVCNLPVTFVEETLLSPTSRVAMVGDCADASFIAAWETSTYRGRPEAARIFSLQAVLLLGG